jgi:hypothetical protein
MLTKFVLFLLQKHVEQFVCIKVYEKQIHVRTVFTMAPFGNEISVEL